MPGNKRVWGKYQMTERKSDQMTELRKVLCCFEEHKYLKMLKKRKISASFLVVSDNLLIFAPGYSLVFQLSDS
jgi:hypothetical protein